MVPFGGPSGCGGDPGSRHRPAHRSAGARCARSGRGGVATRRHPRRARRCGRTSRCGGRARGAAPERHARHPGPGRPISGEHSRRVGRGHPVRHPVGASSCRRRRWRGMEHRSSSPSASSRLLPVPSKSAPRESAWRSSPGRRPVLGSDPTGSEASGRVGIGRGGIPPARCAGPLASPTVVLELGEWRFDVSAGGGDGHPQPHPGLLLRPRLVLGLRGLPPSCRPPGDRGCRRPGRRRGQGGTGPRDQRAGGAGASGTRGRSLGGPLRPAGLGRHLASLGGRGGIRGGCRGRNDISGFADSRYLEVCAGAGAAVVATHIRLAPRVPDPEPASTTWSGR